MRLKWKTDVEKDVVVANFERRGWMRQQQETSGDWNIYWASVSTVRAIFGGEMDVRLNDMQLLNHFPNHYELTR